MQIVICQTKTLSFYKLSRKPKGGKSHESHILSHLYFHFRKKNDIIFHSFYFYKRKTC